MADHPASPVSFLGSVHSAAATQNFIALEHHSVDADWWDHLVTGIEKPIAQDGFVKALETQGLDIPFTNHHVSSPRSSSVVI